MRISGITYVPPRRNKSGKVIKFFFAFIFFAFIVCIGLSAYVGWSLTHPTKDTDKSFLENLSIPKYKEVEFKDTKKAVTLKGWYFQTNANEKTIILAHGYTSNRFQYNEKIVDLVKSFLDKNYNILIFDFRCSGFSGGSSSTVGYNEKYDILGAIDYVKSQGSKHIVLLGVSMGASTSILAASESKDVDAVISDTAFTNLQDFLNEGLSKFSPLPAIFNQPTILATRLFTGIDPAKVDALEALKNLTPRPVLFIHSVNDPTIPFANSKALYTAYTKIAGEKAELWQTDGKEHADSYKAYPKEYLSKVFAFLDKIYPPINK